MQGHYKAKKFRQHSNKRANGKIKTQNGKSNGTSTNIKINMEIRTARGSSTRKSIQEAK